MKRSKVFMVRPVHFGYNEQTAASNFFQSDRALEKTTRSRACKEFDGLVNQLERAGVEVVVKEQKALPPTPDAVFPNNWVSFHKEKNRAFIYPMAAPNRRDEKSLSWVEDLVANWNDPRIIDWSHYEERNLFLEGTGSLILDPAQEVVYASESNRTSAQLAKIWAEEMNKTLVLFNSEDQNGKAVYHTNVVMGVGTHLALGCLDSIQNEQERRKLSEFLRIRDRVLIPISLAQMNEYGGNWIELHGNDVPLFLSSERAWKAYTTAQKQIIESFYEPIVANIDQIESIGGGSVRCMICTVENASTFVQ